MKNRKQLLLKLDDDQLQQFCDRLPLETTDKKLAYAMALLCGQSNTDGPYKEVSQEEVAQLAGLGLRTVKRRLKYLSVYGILLVNRTTGRSNSFLFDLMMLIDAPPPTHDIYRSNKKDKKPQPQKDLVRPLLESIQTEEKANDSDQNGSSFIEWMTGSLSRLFKFTKRTSTKEPVPDPCQLQSDSCQINDEPVPISSVPVPTLVEPVPLSAPIAPDPCQNSVEPVPNPCQTRANSSLNIHIQDTYTEEETLIKTSTLHKHVHGGLDSDLNSGEDGKPLETEPPRKIIWRRDVRDSDLNNPVAVQELYEIAVEQGFFLELDTARLNFFGLANYVLRQKKVKNKVGLFSSNVDRTVKDKFGQPFEQKLSQADEDWARKAIKQVDFPPITV